MLNRESAKDTSGTWLIVLSVFLFVIGNVVLNELKRSSGEQGYSILYLPLAGVCAALFWRGKSLNARSATETRRNDARAPIAFFRPFSIDREQVTGSGWPFAQSYEEQIVGSFVNAGPVVAIGNPQEVWQTPGAARDYFRDGPEDVWKEHAQALIDVCQFALFVVGPTAGGLMHEISRTLETRGRQHLYLFLTPACNSVRWDEFRKQTRHLFGDLPAVLGDGCAIGFTADGRYVLLGDDGRDLKEYDAWVLFSKRWKHKVARAADTILKRHGVIPATAALPRVTTLRPSVFWTMVGVGVLVVFVLADFLFAVRSATS